MEKPEQPGPMASPAEHRAYAEANAKYEAWLVENPPAAAEAPAAAPPASGGKSK